MTHPIQPLERAHAYRLGRIQRLLRRHLISVISQVDATLSPEQFVLIVRLAEEDAVPQSALVDPDLDDRPNITRQVQSLHRRGLVRVTTDPSDGRRRLVRLSRAGRDLFERFVPHVVENRLALFGSLPRADLTAFERVLSHLEERLTSGR